MNDLERYKEACNYPSKLDPEAVDKHLAEYVKALGIKREIVRLEAGWSVYDHEPILESVKFVLSKLPTDSAVDARAAVDAWDARAARAASDARDARDAWDARDAMDAMYARAAVDARVALDARDARDARDACFQSFAAWVCNGGWWRWDLSWVSITAIGAMGVRGPEVLKWSKPCLEAFISGAWILYWTESTLYWVAKPTVHVERFKDGTRRLHNESGPAIESDLENLYFWHGVMVPAFVVTRPEWITLEMIEKEGNAEVRRVMIERYGAGRYLVDSGVKPIHSDDFGTLYVKPGNEDFPALAVVKVVNSTPEKDGTFKDYFLRVHPECRPMIHKGLTWLQGGADPECEQPENGDFVLGKPQELTARNAVASTFGLRGSEYAPMQET